MSYRPIAYSSKAQAKRERLALAARCQAATANPNKLAVAFYVTCAIASIIMLVML